MYSVNLLPLSCISHVQVIPEFEHACDLSLQEKKSLVNSSQQVVLNLDQQGLLDLRTLQRPPEDIEELLVAVINVIKGPNADTTWTKGAKRLMANLDRYNVIINSHTYKGNQYSL